MKYLKIYAIVFGVGFLLQIYAYINLKVSYKYEVDLMETHIKVSKELPELEKINQYAIIEEKKKEILNMEKQTLFLFWFFLIGLLITLALILNRKRMPISENNTKQKI
mgnify:CR=1 FL=1